MLSCWYKDNTFLCLIVIITLTGDCDGLTESRIFVLYYLVNHIIKGALRDAIHIEWRRFVKGEDSPVWQKLQDRFDRLTSKTPEKKSDINYVAAYTMPAFEKQFSTEVSFFTKEFPGIKNETPVISYGASFKKGEEDIIISVSDSCKKLIASGIGDEKAVAELKKKLYVAYCKRGKFPYSPLSSSCPFLSRTLYFIKFDNKIAFNINYKHEI